ncbi:TPA: hypothetical protein JLE96_004781 [Escherichia coli]|nr:hypothetical protein [Escherichia coli]
MAVQKQTGVSDRAIYAFPVHQRLIKFRQLTFYTECFSVCVHEIDYLANKYGFTELNKSPVFAGSGGMFWRRSVGRQMSGQKKAAYCF